MLLNASEEEKVAIKQLQQEKNKELRLKKAESIKQARTHFERDFICEKAALLAVLDTASTVVECSLVARIFKFVPTTSLLNAEHSAPCF